MASPGIHENLENPPKRNEKENFVDEPIFSFPDDVLIAYIFSFLPIKQAIQVLKTVSKIGFNRQSLIDKGVEELDLNSCLARIPDKISSHFEAIGTLKRFSFRTRPYWEDNLCPLVEQHPQLLNCLQFIKLEGFKSGDHEIEMVKYLLQRATGLECLVLVSPNTNKYRSISAGNEPMCRKICQDCDISPKVVHFYGHNVDNSPAPQHSRTWLDDDL
ncbi:hypothetical protein SCA6_020245 [Theobroma cacao]